MVRNIGIVGCGVISVTHLKAWSKVESARVRGVFDLNRPLAEKRSREFGSVEVYDELDRLIEDCDVLDVCTPPQTHAAIAMQVVEAGRHLLIEKPLVTSLDDWERLSELIARSPVNVAVVHNLKFVRSVQQAYSWVQEGKIGDVIAVSRQFLTNRTTDRMLDGRGHWSHQLPGGRWFETLPHELYLTHMFAGPLELSNVTAVRTENPPPGVHADEVLITLQGPRSIATVHYSGNCALNRRMLHVYGTAGMITVDLLSDAAHLSRIADSRSGRAVGRLFLEGAQTVRRMVPDRIGYAYRHAVGKPPHAAIIDAFSAYLDGQGPAPTPIEEVDYVVRNCDLIGRAIDSQVKAQRLSEAQLT